jgi:two-component system, NarL family, sensor kinase
MIFKRIFTFFMVLFWAFSLKSQDYQRFLTKIDALHQIIYDNSVSVGVKLDAMEKLNEERIPFDQKAYQIIDLLLEDNTTKKDDKIKLHLIKGETYFYNSEMIKAESEFKIVYEYFKEGSEINSAFLITYGDIKKNQGKHEEALKIYTEAQKIYEKEENLKNLGSSYIVQSIILKNRNDLNESKKLLQQALKIGEEINDLEIIGLATLRQGALKFDERKFDEASKYFKSALSAFETLENNFYINDTKCYMALNFDEMNRFDESKILFEDAFKYFETFGYSSDKNYILLDRGMHFLRRGLFSDAIASCSKARDFFQKLGNRTWIIAACKCLYISAKNSLDFKAALQYHEEFLLQKDSLLNEKNIEKITELKLNFEFEKEKDRLVLESENKINREKDLKNFLFFGTVILGSILFLIYRFHQSKKEAEAETHRQQLFINALLQNSEEERKRIATDIHDGVNHELLALKNVIDTGKKIHSQNIEYVINELRLISRDLYPAMFDNVGLEASLENLCERMTDAGLFTTCTIDYTCKLSKENELQLYRIVQEALNNTMKHAKAKAAKVTIDTLDNNLHVEIKDNGIGFDYDKKTLDSKSFGLKSIFQRANAIGGKAKIESDANGTRVILMIDNAQLIA